MRSSNHHYYFDSLFDEVAAKFGTELHVGYFIIDCCTVDYSYCMYVDFLRVLYLLL